MINWFRATTAFELDEGVHVLKHGHEQSEGNLVKDRPIVSSISLFSPIEAFSG